MILMLATFIVRTDGKREVRYEEDHVIWESNISYLTYKDISDIELQKIKDAPPNKVQEILSLYI